MKQLLVIMAVLATGWACAGTEEVPAATAASAASPSASTASTTSSSSSSSSAGTRSAPGGATTGTVTPASGPVARESLPPVDDTCVDDADCTVDYESYASDGRCCHSCNPQVGNIAWRARADKACTVMEGEGCPVKKCAGLPSVACVDGRCVARKR